MKQLDHNQMARLADYINGKPITLDDSEIKMLAEDDELAKECLQIAEISAQCSQTQAKKSPKTFRIALTAIAASLILAISIAFLIKNDNSNIATQHQPKISAAMSTDAGYSQLPKEFEAMIQTASTKDYFDYEPNTPFDIEFSTEINADTLFLYSPSVETPLITIPVSGATATITPGLAAGLYYYYLKYHVKERNAISVGSNE